MIIADFFALVSVSNTQIQTHCHARISVEGSLGVPCNEIKSLIDFYGDRLNQPKSPKPPAGVWRNLIEGLFSNIITTVS